MSNYHTKKSGISEEDKLLFRNSVKGVTPLKQDKVTHRKPAKKPPIKTPLPSPISVPAIAPKISENVSGEEKLLFYRPGLQHKIIRKLKRGMYRPEAVLDLHGQTSQQADRAVYNFVTAACKRGHRCVIIIHGKGKSSEHGTAILKSHVNNQLRQQPLVLAFCSAQAKDGGSGAVYVLVKAMSKK
ncbi:MAG: Smr/MutS family protein [Pseudomonadota bacterium]